MVVWGRGKVIFQPSCSVTVHHLWEKPNLLSLECNSKPSMLYFLSICPASCFTDHFHKPYLQPNFLPLYPELCILYSFTSAVPYAWFCLWKTFPSSRAQFKFEILCEAHHHHLLRLMAFTLTYCFPWDVIDYTTECPFTKNLNNKNNVLSHKP